MTTLRTEYGTAQIRRETPQLVAITAETECAAYFAQGHACGAMRLWQLELTRRVAAGELSALFGAETVKTDRFQRDLGLRALARRELARDAGTAQAEHVRAYVAGINRAVERARVLPIELLVLRHKPRAFTEEDVYLIAQLKYFINSAWQFELLHTLIAGHLDARRAAQLFATFTAEGTTIDPLPGRVDGVLAREVADAIAAGTAGLARLGLSSPDIGSNAFALAGSRTRSGAPLLASDPHMGNVNPGYNMLFKLVTGDGLAIVGSHFPGAPGIIVGRNRDCGWGMVGLMADNQDLLIGRVEDDRVRLGGSWVTLERTESPIEVRGAATIAHVARGFATGRLLVAREGHGLFLRWPALDMPLGGVSLCELSRAHDWASFRDGLSRLTNAPMLAVYADREGHRGYQAVGLIPRRPAIGSLVLSVDDRWDGYHAFEALPSALDPSDCVIYANQYSLAMFDGKPHLSNRWHPPTRAARIAELLGDRRHDAASACAIQDDRVDRFARAQLPFLRGFVPTALAGWDGDTRETASALVFERWIAALVDEVTRRMLPPELATRYADMWPAHRWAVLAIVRDDPEAAALVSRAYLRALAVAEHPVVDFRHTLRRHPLARLLFAARYPYDGGTRETIHVARRNTDFLTASQLSAASPSSYNFGPAFKLVYDFANGTTHYLANTPASGNPLGIALAKTLRRWRRGERYTTRL